MVNQIEIRRIKYRLPAKYEAVSHPSAPSQTVEKKMKVDRYESDHGQGDRDQGTAIRVGQLIWWVANPFGREATRGSISWPTG